MDEACKKLANCYKCSRIDSLMRDEEICSPRQVDYLVDLGKIQQNGVLNNCLANNPGDLCAAHSCSCEVSFIKNWMDLFFSRDFIFESDFHHDVWEFETGCQKQVSAPSVLECCGQYPNRVPFDIGGNSKTECCDNKVLYNSEKLKCGKNGSLKQNC